MARFWCDVLKLAFLSAALLACVASYALRERLAKHAGTRLNADGSVTLLFADHTENAQWSPSVLRLCDPYGHDAAWRNDPSTPACVHMPSRDVRDFYVRAGVSVVGESPFWEVGMVSEYELPVYNLSSVRLKS